MNWSDADAKGVRWAVDGRSLCLKIGDFERAVEVPERTSLDDRKTMLTAKTLAGGMVRRHLGLELHQYDPAADYR
jgi:hypothetical protein